MSEAMNSEEILTEEDYLSLQEYRKEKAYGILTSHEDLKNELGMWYKILNIQGKQSNI